MLFETVKEEKTERNDQLWGGLFLLVLVFFSLVSITPRLNLSTK